jgi:DNA-binding transcriptional LysR family regulator
MTMELRHLRYVVAIAEERTVTRAAARLRMQQPPLSQQLRDLERELGFPLFDRSRKGVEPTAAGAVFLEEARRVLAQAQQAKDRAAQTAAGIDGSLAIGFTSSAAMGRIAPEMIADYRALYPRVQLSFSDGNALALTQAVLKSTLDLALVRTPVLSVPEIRCDKLLEEPLLVALALSHPLARNASRRQTSLSLRALADEPFILVRRPGAPGMYANVVAACQAAGFFPRIAHEVESMLTNLLLVAAGVGLTVVPASMRGMHGELIAYFRLRSKPPLTAPMTLLSRHDTRNPALARFLALAKNKPTRAQ